MSDSIKRQIVNLQILRAIAALSVVVGHAVHDSASIAVRTQRSTFEWLPVDWTFGVDVFFVTSGFIMLYTSAPQFGRNGAWKSFLYRRITRVVPLYWLLTSALLLGAAFAPGLLNVPVGSLQHIVSSYLFIPDARTASEIRPVMALGWSLNYEMFFYVLFALSLRLRMNQAVLALSAGLCALALFGQVFHPRQVQLAFWTNPIILEFLLGIYLAMAARAGAKLGLFTASALFVLGWIGACRFGNEAWGIELTSHFLRNGLPAAMIVAAATLGPSLHARSRVALWGSALGAASYSLYLIHPFVVRPMREVWIRAAAEHLPLTLYVSVCVVVSVLTALALFRWVERPMTAFCHKYSKPERLRAALQNTASALDPVRASDTELLLPRRGEAAVPVVLHQAAHRALFSPTVSGPTVV